MKISVLVATVLLCLMATAEGAATSSMPPGVEKLFSEWNAPNAAGCVVGFQRENDAPVVEAFGSADLQMNIPLAQSTKFEVGSIAKIVTALVIGTLVDEHKVSLDGDVRPMLPEIASYPNPITARELLTHTSGVRDFRQLLVMSAWRPEDEILRSDVSGVLTHQQATSFVPGSDALYSNSDFFLLAELASKVLGEPFSQIARERVFAPLSMTDSIFADVAGEVVPRAATGYGRRSETEWRSFHADDYIAGPGALYSTVPDLLKLLANFSSKRVGSTGFLELMESPAQLSDGSVVDLYNSGRSYGFGLELSAAGQPKEIGHDGSESGFAAQVEWLPERGLSVAIACNTWALDLDSLTQRTISELASGTTQLSVDQLRPPAQPRLRPAVEGTYQNATSRTIWLIHRDSGVWKIGHHEMRPRADGAYDVVDSPLARVAFETGHGGAPEMLFWNPDQLKPDAYILRGPGTAFTLSKDGLAEYAGTYYSSELQFAWTFKPEGNKLALLSPKWDADPEFFFPQFRDVFKGESGTIVEFVRSTRGQLIGFRATVDRARGVRFARQKSSDRSR
jgi:CubicO group peptidase (beta-lactamase class C family)